MKQKTKLVTSDRLCGYIFQPDSSKPFEASIILALWWNDFIENRSYHELQQNW